MRHDIIKRATIDEVVAERNQLLDRAGEAFDQLDQLQRRFADLGGSYVFGSLFDDDARRELIGSYRHRGNFMKRVTRNVDRTVWQKIVGLTGFEALMDREAKEQWERSLQEPPEPTAETALATMQGLVESADMMFRRGIAQAFSQLDRRFRSHDGFKVGSRVIINYAMNDLGGFNYEKERTIYDVERVFHQIERGEYVKDIGGAAITSMIGAKRRELGTWEPAAFRVENELFKVDVFKNGNVHLWFKRDDLVREVNRLLAEYYGAALGEGPDAAVPEDAPARPNRTPAKAWGFFETPEELAESVVSELGLYAPRGERRRYKLLEPSAGRGRLALAAIEAAGPAVDLDMTLVEIQPSHADALRQVFCGSCVIEGDFFDQTPETLGLFDAIVMNPPFDRQRDIDHVMHAYRFLRPGGVLVAIMAASVEFRESKKAVALRKLIQSGGWRNSMRSLPERSFAPLTNVNTVLVKLQKPAQG